MALRRLAKETALYGFSTILGRMINYLLVPLYTYLFAPEAYGVVTELYSYVAVFLVLYTYGMETAFFRFAAESPDNPRPVFQTLQSNLLLSSLVLAGVLSVFSEGIAAGLDYAGKGHYIRWLAWLLAIDALSALPFALLRLQNKALKFSLVKVGAIGLNVLFNLCFLVLFPRLEQSGWDLPPWLYQADLGVGYVFLANLLANAFLPLMLLKEWGQFRFRWDPKVGWAALAYAWPILFTGLAGQVNEMLDRLLLKHLLPEGFYPGLTAVGALGVYGACYKLSIFMTLGIQAFRYTAEPFFFKQGQDAQAPATFARVMHYFVLVGALVVAGVSFNLPLLGDIILQKKAYHQGLVVVPVLLLANLFLGVYFNLSVWYKLTDRTRWGMYLTLMGAALTFLLNLVLIPVMGYMGSALTTLAVYLAMSVGSWLKGRTVYPVPYAWGKMLVLMAMPAACYYFYTALLGMEGHPWLDAGLSLGIMGGVAALFPQLHPEEKPVFRAFLAKIGLRQRP